MEKACSGRRPACSLVQQILMAALFCVSVTTAGQLQAQQRQEQKAPSKFTNAGDLVRALEKRFTGYHFLYDYEKLKTRSVPAGTDVSGSSLEEILGKLQKAGLINFRFDGNSVSIAAAADTKKATTNAGYISGTVSDAVSGEPVSGATIRSGAKITISDAAGKYMIAAGAGDSVIITTTAYVGVVLPVGTGPVMNVVLTRKNSGLDEVVVLGFGQSQRKIAQTGAIASVTGKELKQSPVANLTNALAGRLPGLISVQRSGEPGADGPALFIRGRGTLNGTEPLITIDGVSKGSGAIGLLDPNEVESITILKDASATALYGVAGANGVIIIKTRRGKEGKPQVNASIQTSTQNATRLPEYVNSYEFATLANEAYRNDNPNGTLIPYSEEALKGYQDNNDPYRYPSVNWLKEMLKPAQMTRADFNVTGGTPYAKYFVNIGYLQQNGLYEAEKNDQYDPNLKYRRYNFRSNIDLDIDKDFSIGLGLFGAIENKNSPYTSTYDLFNYLLKTPPNQFPIKYPTGFYGGHFRENPFHLLNTTGFIQSFNSSLSGMLTAMRKLDFITKGLFVKGNYSFDGNFTNNFVRKKFARTALYRGVGDLNDSSSYVYDGNDQPLAAPTSENGQTRGIWMDLSLNYDRQFGKHGVTGMLLANRIQTVRSGQIPYVLQGLVARFTYQFNNKYFAEINAGYNGTDNFARGKRYGLFPAVSAGWVLSKESFLANSDVVDFLKVRASYGLTGNDQLPGRRWLFVSEYQTGASYNFGDPLVGMGGTKEGPMANPEVTWEKARKLNIGIEAKLWRDLLGITIDLFREKRNDILVTRGTVPAIIGVADANLPPANMGETVNRGFEIELTHHNRIGRVTYFLRANGSFVRNKILFMDEVSYPYDYLRRTGQMIKQIYGLTAIGFFKDPADIQNSATQFGNVIPGDLKYKDMNGDGVIDANDEGPIGRSDVPEIMFGFSGGLNWKNFDCSFLFQGAANYNVAFSNEGAWEFYNGGSVMKQHLGRWTPQTAATATYPVLHYGINNNNHRASSFFLKDASYLRLKNVEFGYTFRKVYITKKTGLDNVRLFVSGANLLTWDRMGGQSFDPEAPGGKGFYYPQLKVYNVGISTDF